MWYRLLALAVLLVGGLVGLMGAFGSPAAPPAPTLPLPPNLPDDAATQTLDRAVAAMAPERLGFVEMKLWQRVTLPNLKYEATGRYLMGSQRRFRLDLQTKQGGGQATRLAISDGATLWEARRSVSGDWSTVTRLDLAPLLAVLDGEGTAALLRAEILDGPRFGGIWPLLRNVRARMNWVMVEQVSHDSKPRLRLTGVWRADFAAFICESEAWPAGLPEQCRLELDALTLWPHRLEWWGPTVAGGADTLLAELEYRDPVVHTTLSPERCAKEFTFQPGNAAVENLTSAVKAEYAARLK
jgi:hypothetical protein